MAMILSGKEVAAAIKDDLKKTIKKLKKQEISPRLHIVRVGERADDLYYQKSLEKSCTAIGINCTITALAIDCGQDVLEKSLQDAANNSSIHGILLFSPLPEEYDIKAATALIPLEKDVDCLNPLSAGALFIGNSKAYPPCTAAAVMELLKYYKADLEGKKVTVVGRSLVVGKPLSMLLLNENATVTMAHSRSNDLPAVCRYADIVIAATGRAKMFKGNFFAPGQVAVDVGINEDPDNQGRMCGDIEYNTAAQIVAAITPVPGGIGSVTSAILCSHVVDACVKSIEDKEA